MAKPSELGLPPGFTGVSKDTGTMIVNFRGHTGVGKTYTALKTCPGPVVYLNADRDNSLMLRRLRGPKFSREIISTPQYILKFKDDVVRGKAVDESANIARPVRDRFKAEFAAALESKVRYIVVDQSFSIYQMIRIARFGKLTEIAQILYSQTNWEMEQIIHQADNTGKVVIWLSLLEDVWADKIEQTPQGPRKTRGTTGKFTTAGYNKFDAAMGVVADLHYDPETNKRSIKIVKGLSGMGTELVGKDVTIPKLLAAATGEPEERWL